MTVTLLRGNALARADRALAALIDRLAEAGVTLTEHETYVAKVAIMRAVFPTRTGRWLSTLADTPTTESRRRAVQSVPCPTCKAHAGEFCVSRPSGVRSYDMHRARHETVCAV